MNTIMTNDDLQAYGKLPQDVIDELRLQKYSFSDFNGKILDVCLSFKGSEFNINDVVVALYQSQKKVAKRGYVCSGLSDLVNENKIKRVGRGIYKNI